MYSAILKNKIKSWLLISVFIIFIGVISNYFFGNKATVLLIAVISTVYAFASTYFAPNLIIKSINAKEITANSPEKTIYQLVENLCIANGQPMPKVYIADNPTPNAFATGRNPDHAFICIHSGLIQMLDKTELEGVIAHELSHVKNYDIRFMAIVTALITIISYLAQIIRFRSYSDDEDNRSGLLLILLAGIISPIVATLLQLAVSRRRELLADSSGALLTRNPEGLASALEKIAGFDKANIDNAKIPSGNSATAHMYFTSPLHFGSLLARLFSTHPPIPERVKNLREMATKL